MQEMFEKLKIKCPKCGEEFDATDFIKQYEKNKQKYEEFEKLKNTEKEIINRNNKTQAEIYEIDEKIKKIEEEISEIPKTNNKENLNKKEYLKEILMLELHKKKDCEYFFTENKKILTKIQTALEVNEP